MIITEVIPYLREIAPSITLYETPLIDGKTELRLQFFNYKISIILDDDTAIGSFSQITGISNSPKVMQKSFSRELKSLQDVEVFAYDCRATILGQYVALHTCLF